MAHAAKGAEGGPSLTIASARKEIEAIIAFVKNPNPPMPKLHPSPLDDAEVTAVSEIRANASGCA